MHTHPVDFDAKERQEINWDEIDSSLAVDRKVKPVTFCSGGEVNAMKMLENFLKNRLPNYKLRNDPTLNIVSDLSP